MKTSQQDRCNKDTLYGNVFVLAVLRSVVLSNLFSLGYLEKGTIIIGAIFSG
ncbi:hypothetical protein BDZ91DRAFT_726153 [Kalaharituber pfeilii]|nr:hypothetical protein BDZ91DRAFT_726153 [Kalaharituber pfeilii]